MDLQELIRKQREFDRKHGFLLNKDSDLVKYSQLSKELIGLFGEIGEFANNLKKINLSLDHNKNNIDKLDSNLREELVDVMIYILRISDLIDIDIEKEYLNKLKINELKYLDYSE